MGAETAGTAKPIDIYARVSYRVRNEKREPSTEGQVSRCVASGSLNSAWGKARS